MEDRSPPDHSGLVRERAMLEAAITLRLEESVSPWHQNHSPDHLG
jgi:hypothetical protein